MSEKINISGILKDHIRTLYELGCNSLSILDIFVFYGIPFLIAGLSFYLGLNWQDNTSVAIVTAYTIFGGLLFNLLVLVIGLDKEKIELSSEQQRRNFLKVKEETTANLSYSILLCILSLALTLIGMETCGLFGQIVASVIVFFSFNFFFTLLMILKRIHALLRVGN